MFAEEVYIPRCTHCGYALTHPLEMRCAYCAMFVRDVRFLTFLLFFAIRQLSKELLRGAIDAASPQVQAKLSIKISALKPPVAERHEDRTGGSGGTAVRKVSHKDRSVVLDRCCCVKDCPMLPLFLM